MRLWKKKKITAYAFQNINTFLEHYYREILKKVYIPIKVLTPQKNWWRFSYVKAEINVAKGLREWNSLPEDEMQLTKQKEHEHKF